MSYTDMTDVFTYNRKLMWTDLDPMADNAKGGYDEVVEASFMAYRDSSNQSIVTSGEVIFNAESWDVGSFYNTTTGRFTPTTLGRYIIFAAISLTAATYVANTRYRITLQKNGAGTDIWGRYKVMGGLAFTAFDNTITLGAIIDQTIGTDYWSILTVSDPADTYDIAFGLEKSYFCGKRIPNW